MASDSSKAIINDLKESLSKELAAGGESDADRCLDLLKRLDECSIDMKMLTDTLVGVVVSKFKSNEDMRVSVAAKALVKKWKKLAKQSGGVANRTNTAPDDNNNRKQPSTTSEKAEEGLSEEAEKEWEQLPPGRKNMCVKMHQIFQLSQKSLVKGGVNAQAVASLSISRASEMENAMHKFSKGDRSIYVGKARSLAFNLKQNGPLRENILLGSIASEQVVSLKPEQLATAEKARARNELRSQKQDSRLLDWDRKNENKINEMCGIKGDLLKASLFTCGRCKSTKTTSTQKQTRSADEPMTVFVLCLNCGKRWKC